MGLGLSVVEKFYLQVFVGLLGDGELAFFDDGEAFFIGGGYDALFYGVGFFFRAVLVEEEVENRACAFELKKESVVVDKNEVVIGIGYFVAELFE